MTSDHQTERFQRKILSGLYKGLEDIRKAPTDEIVEEPMDKFVTLVKQVILVLGQVSLSVSYTRRLNILKMITKEPGKAKAMLIENESILEESETTSLKRSFSLI